jgi:hypothetical protein
MQEVLECLEMKNHYYQKFLSVTMKLLDNARKEDWEDIDFYVDNRERLLNIIRSFDFKISKALEKFTLSEKEKIHYKDQVKTLLGKRKEIADNIIKADLEIISRIDEMKNETIKTLKKTQETEQQINLFQKPNSNRKVLKNT